MDNQPINTALLWREFSDHVWGFIRSRVPNDKDADDIVQDIFIRIHEGLDNLRDEDKVQSWVFGIARRALVDYYRKRGREKEKPAGTDIEKGSSKDPVLDLNEFDGAHGVHEEVLSWLIPMIDKLPNKYGIPLKMADVEGRSQQEVADYLGLSLPGAKSRIQRARQKLGQVLAACCEVEFSEEGRAVSYRKVKKNDESCENC